MSRRIKVINGRRSLDRIVTPLRRHGNLNLVPSISVSYNRAKLVYRSVGEVTLTKRLKKKLFQVFLGRLFNRAAICVLDLSGC